MQAIILAAGMGKRLKELTENNTKCMVKVDGTALIDRVLHQLDRLELTRVILVVGYEGDKLIQFVDQLDIRVPVTYIWNKVYNKTNNIYSLAMAKDYLVEEDTILLESDIIFEDGVLKALLDDKRDTLALVDKYERWMDGTVVKLDEEDNITEFVPGRKFQFSEKDSYFKTVNVYKFSRQFSNTHYVPFLEAYQKALGNNEYYEQVLSVISILDVPVIKAKRLNGELWYEIDDIQDLDIATTLFAANEDRRVELMQKRFGGYWRYPNLLDFCYLVNPYFPPQKLFDELKANFETLVTQYPSGMKVNSLLAAKNFGVLQEHIVVGNGAAELIKAVVESMTGRTGFIRPTFEEYPNRFGKEQEVIYTPDNPDFRYTADMLTRYFSDQKIDNLVIVNPDNPTGNYLCIEERNKLLQWTKKEHIRLIWDESFADFAEEEDNSLINEESLKEYPNLIVVKSISKSYGIPGLRLGVLAAGDERLIEELKKDVAIWNINSLAEFYMQIEEKYKKDYISGLVEFRRERKHFVEELKKLRDVRVLPSQANYVMAELTGSMTAGELTKRLLIEKNILIKDLSKKIKDNNRQFVRIAVRNRDDNDRLIAAWKEMEQK